MNTGNTPLVVNWHITESCNYSCKGCYSKWNHQHEAWNDVANIRAVVENISEYHRKVFGAETPPWRLSVVGGEPVLFADRACMTIEIAAQNGADVSVISNGSRLENIYPVVPLLSQVGVSIDSFDHQTNMRIGRQCGGKTLDYSQVSDKFCKLRDLNPSVQLKINTVVNQNNFDEILVDKVASLGVSKYKILRQMPFGDCEGVTDEQFHTFLKNNYREDLFAGDGRDRHIFVEDNSLMTRSYLMISPSGCLFQNGQKEYKYSAPLMDTPFETALQQIQFDPDKFRSRYSNSATDRILSKVA